MSACTLVVAAFPSADNPAICCRLTRAILAPAGNGANIGAAGTMGGDAGAAGRAGRGCAGAGAAPCARTGAALSRSTSDAAIATLLITSNPFVYTEVVDFI